MTQRNSDIPVVIDLSTEDQNFDLDLSPEMRYTCPRFSAKKEKKSFKHWFSFHFLDFKIIIKKFIL